MAVILLLLSVIFIYTTPARATEDSNVDATITCKFETGTQLIVRSQMIVNKITEFDTIYNRQSIENIAMTNPYVMGAIMGDVHKSVKSQIETVFVNADVDTISKMPTYEKPYFVDDFRVNLTTAFFRYNGSLNLTNFISGVLDMGATVTYHFNLQSTSGWNTTYVYMLPTTMNLMYANSTNTNQNTKSITWEVNNPDGKNITKDAILSIDLTNPTTPFSDLDDISLELTLDSTTINSIGFTDAVVVKKIALRNYDILPDFITRLDVIPADGIRLFIDNGLFSWTDVFEKTIQPIERQTISLIENSSFNQTLDLSFSWDQISTINCSTPYNITHMDNEPAIKAYFKDSDVHLTICQMPAKAFFGLINAGATASISPRDINFGSGLNRTSYPYSIILRLPTNISLNGDNVFTWNKTTPIIGTFHSGLQPTPPYIKEHIETQVEIDLLKMDLNIPSIFTGKTELTTSTKMKEDDRLYVIRRNGEISFSPKVNISYLNSDAFRLCTEENVFSEDQINSFLSQKTEMFQQRMSEIFHGRHVKGIIDKKIFSNSLIWDGDISAMDNVVPVVVSNYANEVYIVGFNVSLWPAELTFAPQRFTFQGVENQTVTYRITLPQGITVNASDSEGKPLITGKTNDGRDYVELSFDANSSTQSTVLTCFLNVSPVYVLTLFLPCILIFILLVVLVVIIYLIRKKRGGLRRGKGKLFEPEDNEPSDYGGQDYYVPPPPPKKKKK
jgi:hypothetical protein